MVVDDDHARRVGENLRRFEQVRVGYIRNDDQCFRLQHFLSADAVGKHTLILRNVLQHLFGGDNGGIILVDDDIHLDLMVHCQPRHTDAGPNRVVIRVFVPEHKHVAACTQLIDQLTGNNARTDFRALLDAFGTAAVHVAARLGLDHCLRAAALQGKLKRNLCRVLLFRERTVGLGKTDRNGQRHAEIGAAGSIDAVENLKLARDDFIHIPFLKQQDIFVALIFLEDAVERSRPFAEDSADLRAGFAVAVLYALRNLGHIIDHDIRNEYISLTEKQLRLGQFGDIRPEGEIKLFF